jgi:hypothetical protein
MRKIRWHAVVALAVVATFGPVAGQEAKRSDPPAKTATRSGSREQVVPFKAGETLTYDISWSSFMTAGTATVSVREKRSSYGSTAYYIVAEGRPTPFVSRLYPVYYKADTLMDVYSLLSQRGSIYSDEAGDKRTQTTLFDQNARTAKYEVQTRTFVRKNMRVPSKTQDPLAAVYALRALPLKEGARLSMPIADDGEVLNLELAVGDREAVQTGLGSVTGWRIVPTIYDSTGQRETKRDLALWISADDRRLPLKMQAALPVGTFDFTLRSAQATSASQ